MHGTSYLKLCDLAGRSVEAVRLVSCNGFVSLSGTLRFQLELICYDHFCLDKILGKTIAWRWASSEQNYLSGFIKSYRTLNDNAPVKQVFIGVTSGWIFFKQIKKSKVYRNLNLAGLLRVIADHYPAVNLQLELDSNAYPTQESWIQYEETDFEFISRLLVDNHCVARINNEASVIISPAKSQGITKDYGHLALNSLQYSQSELDAQLVFSSSELFMPGDLINFKGNELMVTKSEFKLLDNSIQNSGAQRHDFKISYLAESTRLQRDLQKTKVMGYQLAEIKSYPLLSSGSTQLESLLSWDHENSVSCKAHLAQWWCGYHQGSQFIPRIGSKVVLNFIEADAVAVIIGSYAEQVQQKWCQFKTSFHSLKFNADFILNSRGAEYKKIEGNYQEFIQNNWQLKLGNYQLSLAKASYALSSKAFICRVGSSQLELNELGVKLVASLIELQTPEAKGVGLARAGDSHYCPQFNPNLSPHGGGAIVAEPSSVFINASIAAAAGFRAYCQGPEDLIAHGITDVLIQGREAAHKGALCFHGGRVMESSSNVISVPCTESLLKLEKTQPNAVINQWLSIQKL